MDTRDHDSPLDADARSQLVDSVRRFVARDYDYDARLQALRSEGGFSSVHWQTFADLGWLAIGLPETSGGLGGALDQAALAQELGRALVVEPWLSNCALAAPLLAALGSPRQCTLIGAMIGGGARLAVAAFEREGRYDAFDVQTRAVATGKGWILNGRKTLVLGGCGAANLLVLARVEGERRCTSGLSLFILPSDAIGVSLQSLPTYDGRQTADLALDDVHLHADALLGQAGMAWPALEAAIDRATVMVCAEAVGAMERCLSLTREYLQTRKQFGKAITDYQVVRHRLVDLLVAIEQSRAITEAAALHLAHDAKARRRAVSLAKAFVSNAGRRVGEDSVQLHGAIGMTEAYEVGQCYKRLASIANMFGDADWHYARLAESA